MIQVTEGRQRPNCVVIERLISEGRGKGKEIGNDTVPGFAPLYRVAARVRECDTGRTGVVNPNVVYSTTETLMR